MATRELFPSSAAGVRRISLVRLSGEIARSMAGIGRVAVEGEVHRPAQRPGGRIFFVLRDRSAQITVTCPSARSRRCRTVEGERVCVTGRLTYVNERGQLWLEAEEVVPVGAGAVAAMVAEARRRLAVDGLLDRPRRRLPRLPAGIGVVCGADAAVRADIESVVAVRFPGYPVTFAEVTVSGPGAAESIASALVSLDGRPDIEVIVLARGGGDAVQLLPFSDEELCRTICSCMTPVVSAVGHEGDRPLCDEVADLRCATPSLAAAAVVPDRDGLQSELDGWLASIAMAVTQRVTDEARRLEGIDSRRVIEAAEGLASARLHVAGQRLELIHPARQLVAAGRRLAGVQWRAALDARLVGASDRLAARREQLEALSPASVLERGYAVVRRGDGTVVRRSEQVEVGEEVDIELSAGRLGARVDTVEVGRWPTTKP